MLAFVGACEGDVIVIDFLSDSSSKDMKEAASNTRWAGSNDSSIFWFQFA